MIEYVLNVSVIVPIQQQKKNLLKYTTQKIAVPIPDTSNKLFVIVLKTITTQNYHGFVHSISLQSKYDGILHM